MSTIGPDRPHKPRYGGVVHTYRKYDPQRFPMPQAAPPDLVSPAFNHMMAYGTLRNLTPEQLAEAVRLDPEQIVGLGPSLDAVRALLEERRRKILSTYETAAVERDAHDAFRAAVQAAAPPPELHKPFDRAVRSEQIVDFERLWYRVDEQGPFAGQLMRIMDRLTARDEIDELASNYAFTGRTELTVEQALAVKEELAAIDRLLKQLEEAARNAKVYLIDMEALAEFANDDQVGDLRRIQEQVAAMLEQMAEEQGLIQAEGAYQLSPKAYRTFQGKLLDEIFGDLAAGKTGRHATDVVGDGAVEQPRTKPYEFGDSLANLDVVTSMTNAMVRGGAKLPVRMRPEDLEIHLTRNTPKCATAVVMDMSGSMRWDGLYIHVKRMALALHGLIRQEYPGDFVDFVEMATLARRRHISEVVQLLPKPVTIRSPVVRLMADMGDPDFSEMALPPHFTNLQHGMRLARQSLQVQDTPNRQLVLITDGLPTAHFEDQMLYMLYPPDERTEQATLREGLLCREQGVVINIFLLNSWSQSEEDVRFAHRLAENTRGRVVFVSGDSLERYVVWDYLTRRRKLIG